MTDLHVNETEPSRRGRKVFLIGGLLLAFVVAGFLSGFASGSPDGLEKVAADEGFLDSGGDHAFGDFFLADYAVAGIENERLAAGLAGVIGVVATLAVGTLLFWGVSRLTKDRRSSSDSHA